MVLPAQPTTGRVRYSPLGGDGRRSPDRLCDFDMQLACDASSGTATLSIDLDVTYAAVICFMRAFTSSLTPADFQFRINPYGDSNFSYAVAVEDVAGFRGGAASCLWVPPPMYCEREGPSGDPPFIRLVTDNTDGQTITYRGQMLMFTLRARDTAPLEAIYASLPRSGFLFTS